jgi:xanthine dehydrogenase small subunit
MSTVDFERFEMRHVADLDELCAVVSQQSESQHQTVLLAGGTDFMVQVSQGALLPDPLPLVVDISRLKELRQIEVVGDTLTIGAACTYLELQRHPIIQKRAPLLAAMGSDIGGPTIQARGTLGGNLATASPAADGVAALAAFDPTIVVRSSKGERKIPFSELQTGYKTSSRTADEVIVSIVLKLPAEGSAWCWRKVGTRQAQAISKMAFAAVATLDAGRAIHFSCGMASVAPTTALLDNLRERVRATPLAELDRAAVAQAIAADIQPIDDIRSTAEYRLHTATAIACTFLRELGAAT